MLYILLKNNKIVEFAKSANIFKIEFTLILYTIFHCEINNITKLPLLFWDERYSTQAINKMMIKQDLSRNKRKLLIDQSAATWILEGVISTINT